LDLWQFDTEVTVSRKGVFLLGDCHLLRRTDNRMISMSEKVPVTEFAPEG